MNINIAFTNVYSDIEKAIKDGYRIIINEGASRSSKTHSLMQMAFLNLLEKPSHTQTVMRDTKTSCRKIVEKEFIEFLKDPMGRRKEFEEGTISIEQYNEYLRKEGVYKLLKHNKSNHTFTYEPKGSVLLFDGADSVEDIIGMGNDVIWINEPYKFDPEVFNQLKQRTRGVIIIDLNPKQKLQWLEELKDRNDTISLHSTFLKNNFLSTNVRNEILAYQPLIAKFIPKDNKSFYEKYKIENHLDIEFNEQFNRLKQIKDRESAELFIDKLELTDYQKSHVLRTWSNEIQKTARPWHWEVYGLGKSAESPNRIFTNWKPIYDDYYNSLPYLELYATDFGMYDPCTLVSLKYYDGKLYVKLHVYKPESEMLDNNGVKIPLSTYFLNNSTLKQGTHTQLICESQDYDKNSSDGKVIQLIKAGINAVKVNKPNIMERIKLVQEIEVFYVDNKEGNMNKELEVYSLQERITRGKTIIEPDPSCPEHSLDAVGYGAWHMYEQGLMKHIDLGNIR